MSTSKEDKFTRIVERLKESLKVRTDSQLAEVLGMTPAAFSNRKKSESVPYEQIIDVAAKTNVDLNWVFLGIHLDQVHDHVAGSEVGLTPEELAAIAKIEATRKAAPDSIYYKDRAEPPTDAEIYREAMIFVDMLASELKRDFEPEIKQALVDMLYDQERAEREEPPSVWKRWYKSVESIWRNRTHK